jgi:hypothetical protein
MVAHLILTASTLFGWLAALAPQLCGQGGVPLWTNRVSEAGSGFYQRTAVGVNPSGSVFVAGTSYGLRGGYATIKYSSAGVPLRNNRYNGPGNREEGASAVAVDGSGKVFVTGESYGSGGYDYATVAFSGTGLALWTNRYSAYEGCQVRGVMSCRFSFEGIRHRSGAA